MVVGLFGVLTIVLIGFGAVVGVGLKKSEVVLGLTSGLTDGLISGLIGGLISGLVLGLIRGLKSDITIRTQPNQGILASAKNALFLTIFGGFLAWLLNLWLNATLPKILTDSDRIQAIVGVSVMIAIFVPFFSSGGFACIQHFTMRFLIWRSGAIPWNYARFLKYTSELRLTRQTGGEFRFFHDLLREHLVSSRHS